MTDWIKQAACRGMNPATFFPERGDTHTYRQAINICNNCPVQQPCRDYGIQLDEQELTPGIFGGMSQRERRQFRAANRRSSTLPMGRTAPSVGTR